MVTEDDVAQERDVAILAVERAECEQGEHDRKGQARVSLHGAGRITGTD